MILESMYNHAQTLRALRSWEGDKGAGVDSAVERAYASLSGVTNDELDQMFVIIADLDEGFAVVPDIRMWV